MPLYILKRLLSAIPLLWGLLTLTFFLIRLAPGDPVALYIESDVDPRIEAHLRESFGLNESLPVQYGKWLGAMMTGDFGISFRKHRPVIEVLEETIPKTILLTGAAFLINLLLGVLLGTLSALYKDRPLDRLIRQLMLVIYSMPGFWLSLMLILLVSLQLDLLPASQISSPNADLLSWPARILDVARHMILPVFVLGVGSATATGRYMRASMLDVINQDYIRTARAKGLSEFQVLGKHAMRNAIIPIITVSGLSLPSLLGGAVIVEAVFSWHGMGYLTIEAIFSRDYPLIIATTFVAGVMVILGNLIADVSYALVDPRIRTGGGVR